LTKKQNKKKGREKKKTKTKKEKKRKREGKEREKKLEAKPLTIAMDSVGNSASTISGEGGKKKRRKKKRESSTHKRTTTTINSHTSTSDNVNQSVQGDSCRQFLPIIWQDRPHRKRKKNYECL
jgi:hypothetical protein